MAAALCHKRSLRGSHGTLQTTWQSPPDRISRVSGSVYEAAQSFFTSMNRDEKDDFYAKMYTRIGTLYTIEGNLRLDVQSPLSDATNLQVQDGPQTLATLVVSNELNGFGGPSPGDVAKRAEIVNYVTRQFGVLLRASQKHQAAFVAKVSPITPSEELATAKRVRR